MLYVFLSLIQNTYVYCRYVNNKKRKLLEVGFEPTKLSQRCLRPSPLTTRESQLMNTFKLKCSVRGLNS